MYAAMDRAITALGKREKTNQSDQMSGICKLFIGKDTDGILRVRTAARSSITLNTGYSG
jgi:hypothetical protein